MNPRPQNPDPFFSSKSQFLNANAAISQAAGAMAYLIVYVAGCVHRLGLLRPGFFAEPVLDSLLVFS